MFLCGILLVQVADGRRDYLEVHDLKKRKILGNTTMDPTLSIIMSNMGLVQEGSLVLDPFVGSGKVKD
jgi:tRNA (guanine10-N2)-methyltransferase